MMCGVCRVRWGVWGCEGVRWACARVGMII